MKRWPIIRHIRYFYWAYRVDRHYRVWRAMTGTLQLYTQYDYDRLDGIWRGEE